MIGWDDDAHARLRAAMEAVHDETQVAQRAVHDVLEAGPRHGTSDVSRALDQVLRETEHVTERLLDAVSAVAGASAGEIARAAEATGRAEETATGLGSHWAHPVGPAHRA